MFKNRITILTVSIAIFSAAGLFYWENYLSSEKKSGVDNYYIECSADSDCISVPRGFCECTEGGTAIAINKTKEREWKDKAKKDNPDGGICFMMSSNDPTCRAYPRCIRNKCSFFL